MIDELLAPAGTPRPIVDKLNSALHAALANPKAQKTFAEGGMDPFPAAEETPEAASALLKREIKLWGDFFRIRKPIRSLAIASSPGLKHG